jgi:hypothetical protein
VPFTAVKLSVCNIDQITFPNRTVIQTLNVILSLPVHTTTPTSCHAAIQQQIYLVICSFIPSVIWCAFGHGITWCALSQMNKVMNTWQPTPLYYLCSWLHRTFSTLAGQWLSLRSWRKFPSATNILSEAIIIYYLTPLSVAKTVWQRCEMNGTSVRSTAVMILTGQTPSTRRAIRPTVTPSTINRLWTVLGMTSDLRDVRLATACLSHQRNLFFTNWHEPFTAQWSLYVPPV